ncbi:unnamed protein product [Ophioblennius macclurei]
MCVGNQGKGDGKHVSPCLSLSLSFLSVTQWCQKMGHLTVVAFLAVLFSFFVETEANPFVYNYERLRIAGLICASLLVAGGITVILYNKCSGKSKKGEDDNSEI